MEVTLTLKHTMFPLHMGFEASDFTHRCYAVDHQAILRLMHPHSSLHSYQSRPGYCHICIQGL